MCYFLKYNIINNSYFYLFIYQSADLSLFPGSHMVQGEDWLLQGILWPLPVSTVMCDLPIINN